MHKGNSNVRGRNRVTVVASSRLLLSFGVALLAFPFTSELGGNNCFRRIVQRDRFSYRRFSLTVRRRRRRFVGYVENVGRYTRCILMHTRGPHWGHLAFSHFARRDCYTPRKCRSALRENFLRCLIIFRPKTFLGLRPVYYHPLRLRGFSLYVGRGGREKLGAAIKFARIAGSAHFLHTSGSARKCKIGS